MLFQRKKDLLRARLRGVLPIKGSIDDLAHLREPPLRFGTSLLAADGAAELSRGIEGNFKLLFHTGGHFAPGGRTSAVLPSQSLEVLAVELTPGQGTWPTRQL